MTCGLANVAHVPRTRTITAMRNLSVFSAQTERMDLHSGLSSEN